MNHERSIATTTTKEREGGGGGVRDGEKSARANTRTMHFYGGGRKPYLVFKAETSYTASAPAHQPALTWMVGWAGPLSKIARLIVGRSMPSRCLTIDHDPEPLARLLIVDFYKKRFTKKIIKTVYKLKKCS